VKKVWIALAVLLLSATADVALPQKVPVPAPSASPALPTRPSQGFDPGLDDLMTLLIQPRHIKLHYAGTQKNWELAAAQLSDLRAAFDRISQAVPKYQGSDVDEAIKAIIAPKMQALDVAVAAADAKRFAVAYGELTAACNACHVYLEHPFLVIEVPGAKPNTAYPDQSFSAQKSRSEKSRVPP
jgi:hypothetical protein